MHPVDEEKTAFMTERSCYCYKVGAKVLMVRILLAKERGAKVLMARILLAKEMGAKVLMAKSDSLLVTGQVTGEFQAKDPEMAAYLEYVQELRRSFVFV